MAGFPQTATKMINNKKRLLTNAIANAGLRVR